MRVQHSHKGQVAVALRKIEAVADHEQIRNLETDEIRLDLFDPARRFIEQNAGANPPWFKGAQFSKDAIEGLASIKNIIHQQDVAPAHIQTQFFGDYQVTRFSARPIAGDTHEIEPERQRKIANQIR